MDSLWLYDNKTFQNIDFKDNLDEDFSTDICIIGAGIFGLTCAYYLSNLGYKVTVLEKSDIASKVTSHTTGKITSQHGLFYEYLTNSYGQKFAKDYLDANEDAIQNIKNIIDKENINCDFKYQNSYVYTTKNSELNSIKKEYNALSSLCYNCELVTKTGLPFDIVAAICFKNQAEFHPVKYLSNLCRCIIKRKGEIYTNTTAVDVKMEDSNYTTYANMHKIKSKFVIIATHYPFINFPRILFY